MKTQRAQITEIRCTRRIRPSLSTITASLALSSAVGCGQPEELLSDFEDDGEDPVLVSAPRTIASAVEIQDQAQSLLVEPEASTYYGDPDPGGTLGELYHLVDPETSGVTGVFWSNRPGGRVTLDFGQSRSIHEVSATVFMRKDRPTCPRSVVVEVGDGTGTFWSQTLQPSEADCSAAPTCTLESSNGNCLTVTALVNRPATTVRVTTTTSTPAWWGMAITDVDVTEQTPLGPSPMLPPIAQRLATAYPTWDVEQVAPFGLGLGKYSLPIEDTKPRHIVPGQRAYIALAIPNPATTDQTLDVQVTGPGSTTTTVSELVSTDQEDFLWKGDLIRPLQSGQITVEPGSVGHLWIEVDVPAGTAPGLLSVPVVVSDGVEQVTVTPKILVAAAELSYSEEPLLFGWDKHMPCVGGATVGNSDADAVVADVVAHRRRYGENADQTYSLTTQPLGILEASNWQSDIAEKDEAWAPYDAELSGGPWQELYYTMNGNGSPVTLTTADCHPETISGPKQAFYLREADGCVTVVCPGDDAVGDTPSWHELMVETLKTMRAAAEQPIIVAPVDEPKSADEPFDPNKSAHSQGWMEPTDLCPDLRELDFIRYVGMAADDEDIAGAVRIAANPQVTVPVESNSGVMVPVEDLTDLEPYVDIWMPNLKVLYWEVDHPDWEEQRDYYAQTTHELWAYNGTGAGQVFRAPAVRRQVGWRVWDKELGGYGYWNLYELAGTEAPREAEGVDFAMIYEDCAATDSNVRASRRMAAFGKARDDMRLLASVQNAIDGGTCPAGAQQTMDDLVQQVANDPTLADLAVDALIALLVQC